jgi:hypothetical protein
MMRTISFAAILFVGAIACATSLAQDSPAVPEADAPPPPPMQEMQSSMRQMREQMTRITETQDPAERERLMREHMSTMHRGMAMMGQMMREQREEGAANRCAESDMQCRMAQMQRQQGMMGQRMGMMHAMMQQMMEHMTQEHDAPAQ